MSDLPRLLEQLRCLRGRPAELLGVLLARPDPADRALIRMLSGTGHLSSADVTAMLKVLGGPPPPSADSRVVELTREIACLRGEVSREESDGSRCQLAEEVQQDEERTRACAERLAELEREISELLVLEGELEEIERRWCDEP